MNYFFPGIYEGYLDHVGKYIIDCLDMLQDVECMSI